MLVPGCGRLLQEIVELFLNVRLLHSWFRGGGGRKISSACISSRYAAGSRRRVRVCIHDLNLRIALTIIR